VDPDFVVVANRLPVDLERTGDGAQRWTQSPGGLVSALEPFLRSRKGAWVGWPGVPDVEVDAFEDEGVLLHPVPLSTADIRESLGNPRIVMLGVDRLDYTKGIDLRLKALHELLDEGSLRPEEVAFVQLATPSRERVEHYQQMRSDIERIVSRINGEFARVGRPVVHYLHQSVNRAELAAFFRAADVMVVTPLRDGMNLVCKEYVACRHDQQGALVLSEFAGAAAELTSAFLVNPHDLDGVKSALRAAITLDPSEGRSRMRALRRRVLTHDVDRWARSFLEALGA
jgi:trehalose 6-phosphate synthase